MKLSFSLSSKSQPKKPTAAVAATEIFESLENTTTTKQYITEFDPSKPLTKSKHIIIPPKPNESQPHKKMKNLNLTADNQPLQFEVDPGSNIQSGLNSMSYWLNVRGQVVEEEVNGSKPSPDVDPSLQKLKEDLRGLPEDNGNDYNDVPVEGFGAALLRGYGWNEGKGIGRNTKEDVKVYQIKKWAGKQGLGFMGTGGKDSKKDGTRHRQPANLPISTQKQVFYLM